MYNLDINNTITFFVFFAVNRSNYNFINIKDKGICSNIRNYQINFICTLKK